MRFFLVFLIVAASDGVWAQQAYPVKVGAMLPMSGAQASVGTAQRVALEESVAALRSDGIALELTLIDARGVSETEADAADLVNDLVDGGVHALICCNTPAEAAQLAPVAAAAALPLLTLAPLPASSNETTWVFSLAAEEVAVLERLLLEPDLHPVGLMAPVGPVGDHAAALLEPVLLQPVQSGAARYPDNPAAPLTPEALLLATQGPASVVLWDEGAGSIRAAEALAARGYEGDVIVRREVWTELGALGRAGLTGAKSVVSPALLGYTLADTHPSKGATSSFRRALVGLPGAPTMAALELGARAWDAALLLGLATEQVLTYSLDGGSLDGSGPDTTSPDASSPDANPDAAATLRSALRDALIGLEPTDGAGGRYDFGEGSPNGLEPGSLVLAVWRGGQFRPGP